MENVRTTTPTTAPIVTNVPSTVSEEDSSSVKASPAETPSKKPRFELGTKVPKIFEDDQEGYKIHCATIKSFEQVVGEKNKLYLIEYDDGEEEHVTEKEVEELLRKERTGILDKTLQVLKNPPLEPPIALDTAIKCIVDDEETYNKTGIALKKMLHGKLVNYGPVASRQGVELLFEVKYDGGEIEHLSKAAVTTRLRHMKHHGLERRLDDFNCLKIDQERPVDAYSSMSEDDAYESSDDESSMEEEVVAKKAKKASKAKQKGTKPTTAKKVEKSSAGKKRGPRSGGTGAKASRAGKKTKNV